MPIELNDTAQVTIEWTPERVRRLRGQRTQEKFGKLLGVPKNTVWRWEAGYTTPDVRRSRVLSELAKRERFAPNWQLAGSATLIGDLEEGSRHIRKHLKPLFRRSAGMMD